MVYESPDSGEVQHSGHRAVDRRLPPGDRPAKLRRGPERQNSLLFALIMESSPNSQLEEL
ncbi:hypothetical protein JCGZ_08788 [Jatropha curcas]|uniref:Uncharacterized protein n=1 Tax=Jatropha curcas TaxID=180498 RepID=A0A067KWD0_JATCU|nr:hypothetical protein JCGZ_08788 [Jatropha curcas]